MAFSGKQDTAGNRSQAGVQRSPDSATRLAENREGLADFEIHQRY
jgi:hypothetical protein